MIAFDENGESLGIKPQPLHSMEFRTESEPL